jgi:hypothetical protein
MELTIAARISVLAIAEDPFQLSYLLNTLSMHPTLLYQH